MSQSIRKSAVASTVKDPETGVPMEDRCVVLFANLSANVFAQSSCLEIHVRIHIESHPGEGTEVTIRLAHKTN